MKKYIGGSNQTMGQVTQRVITTLTPLPHKHLGWPWQCYCGKFDYVKYRGRFYCWHCGITKQYPDMKIFPKYPTFREAFEKENFYSRQDGAQPEK